MIRTFIGLLETIARYLVTLWGRGGYWHIAKKGNAITAQVASDSHDPP